MNSINSTVLERFREYVNFEYNYPFVGWDFAHIRDRFTSAMLPWSYSSKVLKIIREQQVSSMLDMGTGGGEFLRDNFQPFPKKTWVTEAYPPNIPVAKQNLEDLGVEVFAINEDSPLPFKNNEFELIINQHESYDPQEVYRILKPEGIFITKQVDGSNDTEICELLDFPNHESQWNLMIAQKGLEKAGFRILEAISHPMRSRFFDIGALVYYIKIAPWSFPEFNPEEYLEKLFEIHQKITKQGYLEITTPRFMIIAKKEV